MNLIPKWWRDITENPPGHTVAKDLFRAQAFYSGLLLLFISAAADWMGRHVSPEPGLFLLAYALGASGLKAYEKFQDRKTADAAGNPLAVPNPPGYTPPIMEQIPNPNAPAGHTDQA